MDYMQQQSRVALNVAAPARFLNYGRTCACSVDALSTPTRPFLHAVAPGAVQVYDQQQLSGRLPSGRHPDW
jgi:hypothetical protein